MTRATAISRITHWLPEIVTPCFLAGFLYLSAVIVFHALFEPDPRKALTNLESAAAVGLVACFCAHSSSRDLDRGSAIARWPAFLPLITVLPFLFSIRAPLLFDSYAHVVQAGAGSFADALNRSYGAADGFFRPLGYADYWLEYKWAGFHAWVWHLDGLLLHLATTYLVYVLCRKLSLSPLASSFAALFFGLHGTNPEDVFWTAARFDQLAAIFVLFTLILLCEYTDKKSVVRLAAMFVCCALALVSKESAFCVAGLAVCCLWWRRPLNARGLKSVASIVGISMAIFAYRYSVVGGIGGYRDAHGNSIALHFHPLHLLEVVVFRMWGVLLFPINWSVAPQVWLSASVALLACAGLVTGFASRPRGRMVVAALGFCIVGIAPAVAGHLASLTATISGSRVFYIPSIGLALLIGAVYDGFAKKGLASAAVTGLLVFQSAALVHNLLIWRDTAYLARRTCVAFARLADRSQPAYVLPLPRLHHGVYFLANGFSDCVFVNAGKRIAIAPGTKARPGEKVFSWDQASESVKEGLP